MWAGNGETKSSAAFISPFVNVLSELQELWRTESYRHLLAMIALNLAENYVLLFKCRLLPAWLSSNDSSACLLTYMTDLLFD